MNITEFMSFDLAWFTTLPGILITGGVVVLLIALIFFITSNKKEKNKSAEVVSVDNSTQSVENNFDASVNNDMTSMSSIPVENNFSFDNSNSDINVTPAVGVVDFSATTSSVVPSAEEVAPSTIENDSNVAPVMPVEPVVPTVPEVAPVVNNEINNTVTPTEPVVESTPSVEVSAPAEPVVPVVEETVSAVEEVKPVIYGGANPASVESTPVVEKPVIYGGANPLENTTTLPKMDNHVAYGASNVTAVEPTPEVTPVPVVEETPAVEVSVPVEPVVENVVPTIEINPEPATILATSEEVLTPSVNEVAKEDSLNSDNEIETLDF